MFPQFKYRIMAPLAGLLLATPTFAQDNESSFRSKVRTAFDQDTPTIGEGDAAREFRQRKHRSEALNYDTEIPEVARRQIGPRISVTKIKFHNLQEYPKYDIYPKDIEALAEELRADFMEEDQLLQSGYTKEEVEELALMLEELGTHGDPQGISAGEVQRLSNVVERQNAQRGLTYADLEDIADRLTAYYRRHGLFLAQVQIPAQEVKDGVVTFAIQEGRLGQVAAEGEQKYSLKLLSSPFKSEMGKLVSHENIEEGIYLLNDLPNLSVTGYFSAGDNPGETRLNLKTREENSWRIVSRFDNHGSTFTGDHRLYNSVDWFNPLGIGDALTIGYLKSNNAENASSDFGSDLGQLRYSLPLLSPRTRLQLSADYNKFKLKDPENDKNFINIFEIEGVNESYALSVDHKFRRSRAFNFTGSFGLTEKESKLESKYRLPEPGEHTYGAEIGSYLDHMSTGALPMLNTLSAKVQYGEHQNPVDSLRGEDFTKFALDASSLVFIPMPFSDKRSRLILKGRAQYSDNSLPAFEQIPLGGANGVRAFNVRDFSADKAGLISAEWFFEFPAALNPSVFGSPLNDIFQVALIADGGYGRINNYEENLSNDWAKLAGAGLLLKFSWQESFASQMSIAWNKYSKTSVDNMEAPNDPTVYADFTFFF